ncbi:FAD/NAD(P)-binding domain-containing protein [Daldinia decipiens]|uniref:FAD/NAD(P)-binding domain-containing protein n=1 Tax=Daldinia decipiens TaxID=326647 RepID=UPI0020C1EBA4|nr:FAD/NAD(P)-binding domain-containing protein [Daldinia decipiens]KAI1658880.1 FAD/NAD(P)-binding domain-containing protein [Daldinia decipiens]
MSFFAMMGSVKYSTQFEIKEAPIDGHRPMKVRVIGAGYSGIYMGIRIPQRLRNIDFQIYERNESVGGTWWANKYPGCACDIPAHSYQYSFNPNPDWSAFYAPQKEICSYLQGTAEKYGVLRYVKLSHSVESCRWDDNRKKWTLMIKRTDTNETFEDEADVLVSARGSLSDPAWPNIPGLKSFKGETMHSALWKEGYDFKNKRIGVIGNGSSAIQIVPKLQKIEGTKLSCFVRSKTWITNPFGDSVMEKLGLDPTKFEFTSEQRQEFAKDPEKFLNFRRIIEVDGNISHPISLRESEMQREAIGLLGEAMRQRLSKKPEIAEFLIPAFGIGCRRNTPGPGYLEALVEDNVDFITDPIETITEGGITLKSGRLVPLDVLVCATGFNTSSAPPFPVYGRTGQSLQSRFTPYPTAYLALTVDSFPNFFMMLGPNAAIGAGSLTVMLENQGDYIIKSIRKLQKEDYASMTIKPERMRDWDEYCDEYFKRTVYTDACHSWYKSQGGLGERIVGLWPGSALHALEALRAPRWEDYDWESIDGKGSNKLRWLGNGWSITHSKGEGDNEWGGNPAWYIEPNFLDIPIPGNPEDDKDLKMRPFSH